MKSTLKTLALAAALLGASLAAGETASAMPVASAPVVAGQSAPIVQAGWRCGPGWHMNGWGRCVPNHPYGRPWGPRPGRWRRW
jgi:hypothetical protein